MATTPKQLEKNSNDDAMRLAYSEVRKRLERIEQGGGTKNIEKEHQQGKFTARERRNRCFRSL